MIKMLIRPIKMITAEAQFSFKMIKMIMFWGMSILIFHPANNSSGT